MISRTTQRFREAYEALPEIIQRQARDAYRLFRQDPTHPSLRFRQVHPSRPIYSARINLQYRALGIRDDGYDRLVLDRVARRLRTVAGPIVRQTFDLVLCRASHASASTKFNSTKLQ